MEVLNVLGHGVLEKPYENALIVEFGLQGGAAAVQQPWFDVNYKAVKVGEYIIGLIINFKHAKLEWKRVVL